MGSNGQTILEMSTTKGAQIGVAIALIVFIKKRGIIMTNDERYEKYIKEHCSNWKHRKEDLCDIRISVLDDIITTKCVYYEKEN